MRRVGIALTVDEGMDCVIDLVCCYNTCASALRFEDSRFSR